MRDTDTSNTSDTSDKAPGLINLTLRPHGTYPIQVGPHVTVDELLTALGHSPSLYLVWIDGQLVPGSTELTPGDDVCVRTVRSDPVLRKPMDVVSMVEGKPFTVQKRDSPATLMCEQCHKRKAVTEKVLVVRSLVGHLRLCASCFCNLVERKVLRTILWWDMIEPHDCVMVPVSGEKDSMFTFYMLAQFKKYYPDAEIFGCIVDEGLGTYSERKTLAARTLAAQLHFPLEEISFKHALGYTLPELVDAARESSCGLRHRPCYFCNVLKENLLQAAAHEYGATKVALSRNYNDRLNAVLQGTLLQDITAMGNAEFKGTLALFNLPFVSIIAEIPEKDIATYLHLSGIPVHWHDEAECPFSESAVIGHLNYLVSDLEALSPGASNYIMSSYQRHLKKVMEDSSEHHPISYCRQCGVPFPSIETGSLCPACQVLAQYNITRR